MYLLKTNRTTFFLILLLLTLAIISFRPFTTAEFLLWDDQIHVSKNPFFNEVTFDSIIHFWTTPYQHLYIPITYTIWGFIVWLLQQLYGNEWRTGDSILVFTFLNFVAHLLNTFFVYKILRFYFKNISPNILLFGTSIFLLHPIQVESVVWISGFRDLIGATFSLITILFYLQEKKNYSYLSFILAVLCKPNSLMIAILIMLLEIQKSYSTTKKIKFHDYKYALSMIILSLPLSYIIKSLQPDRLLNNVPNIFSRFLIAFDSIGFYISNIVWPTLLVSDYGRRPAVVLSEFPTIEFYVFIAFVIISTVGILKFTKTREEIVRSLIFFLAPITPVLGFVPFAFQRFSTVADRYLYLSFIGLSIFFVLILSKIKWPKFWGLAILLPMTALSFNQSLTWKTNLSLIKNESRNFPINANSEVNLGHYLAESGQLLEAKKRFQKAFEIDPYHSQAASNLGTILMDLHEYEEAEEHFKKTLTIQPRNAEAQIGYGILLDNLKRYDESLIQLKLAVELEPQNSFGLFHYSMALWKVGKMTESLFYLRRAIELDPNNKSYKKTLHDVEAAIGKTL